MILRWGKILALLCWPWGMILLAQNTTFNTLSDRFASLTENDGLSSNNLRCLLQNREGFIWIGTADGLNRFDGTQVRTFKKIRGDSTSLSGNNVHALLEDSQGNLWVGMEGGGLCRYLRTQNTFVRYTSIAQDSLSLSGINVTSLYEDRAGKIWIGYRGIGQDAGGLTCLDLQTGLFSHHLTEVRDYGGFAIKVTHILEDPQEAGIFWLGGRSLIRYDSNTGGHKEYRHPAMVFNFGFTNGLLPFTDTSILVATIYGGVLPFNTKEGTWGDFLYEGQPMCMKGTANGQLWLGDFAKGLGLFSKDLSQVNFYQRTPDDPFSILEDRRVNEILLDRNGILWAATSKGLTWIDPLNNRFEGYNLPQNLQLSNGRYRTILDLGDAYLLIGNEPVGLRILDREFRNVEKITLPPELAGFKPNNYCQIDSNTFYIGGNHGICRLNTNTREAEFLPFSNRTEFADKPLIVYSFFRHSDGRFWFGSTLQGFFHWDPVTGKIRAFQHDPNDSNSLCHDRYLFSIEEDEAGNIWIATDKGISVFDPQQERFLDLLQREGDPLAAQIVHFVERDRQGRMWLGSRDNGLFCYDPQQAEGQRIREFTMADGLPYPGLNGVVEDVEGNLWLESRKGFSHLNIQNFKITNFSVHDGLPEDCCYISHPILHSDSAVVVTVSSGQVIRFFPHKLARDTTPPRLFLEELRVNGEIISQPFSTIQTKGLDLAYDQNFFALRFGAIEFTQADRAQYWYRLAGLEEDWIPTRPGALINYSQLPGGSYRFQLKGVNKDGTAVNKKLDFPVQIGIPFWKQWWFLSMIFLLIAILLWSLYHYRIRQIRLREALQTQIAEVEVMALRSQMNPHFIFNCLNSLKHFIIANEVKLGAEYVNKFSKLVRMILEHTESSLIPLTEDWEALQAYIELEQMRFENKLEVTYEVSPELFQVAYQIPPLLVQPYVENAIRHGLLNKKGPGKLTIRLRVEGQRLHYTIDDDGIGRAKALAMREQSVFQRRSMGMTISDRRMAVVKQVYGVECELKIVDKLAANGSAAGTCVELYLPILKKQRDV